MAVWQEALANPVRSKPSRVGGSLGCIEMGDGMLKLLERNFLICAANFLERRRSARRSAFRELDSGSDDHTSSLAHPQPCPPPCGAAVSILLTIIQPVRERTGPP